MNRVIHVRTLFDVFANPELVTSYSDTQWQALIRVLRGGDMLAAFYYLLARSSLIEFVPKFALKHLESAKTYADRQAHQVRSEAKELKAVLGNVWIEPIFLKGAAYVLRGDTNHFGRVMSDIDILVRHNELNKTEEILQKHDWAEKQLDPYDADYYRKWAHELPPYRHVYRGTALDIHFTLLPPICGLEVAEQELFSGKQLVENDCYVLNPELIILHCIVHLFYNEDFEKSFRDIYDIHLLVTQLEAAQSLKSLISLGEKLGFKRELHYALCIRDMIFATQSLDESDRVKFSTSILSQFFIKKILYRALMPSHDLLPNRWNSFARFIMYIRGHLLKMPPKVLIPHMAVKMKKRMVTSVMGAHHYEK